MLDRLRREHPCINDFLLGVVSERVLRLSTRMRELLYLPVEVRIQRRLLDLSAIYDQSEDGVVIPLRREDIGDLAGASRAMATTVIKRLERAGVLRNARRQVTILNVEKLRERAGVAGS